MRQVWQTGELQILQKGHNKLSRQEITNQINEWRESQGLAPRTMLAVSQFAYRMGYTYQCHKWTEAEREFLERNHGHPLTQLHQYYNRYGKTQGWPHRTKDALRKQLYRMGLCCDGEEYLSIQQVSRLLQVAPGRVKVWLQEHPHILSPLHNNNGTFIHRKRLKHFICKFAGEIEPRNNRELFLLNLLRET